MAELNFCMPLYVGFNLIPISLVISDSFARGTDWQQATQRLDIGKGFLQF